jgi:manganese transport protein
MALAGLDRQHAFAVALLASGQSSTISGTLAGQVVMGGFIHWKLTPWIRRLITRGLAILPAIVIIGIRGGSSVNDLLIAGGERHERGTYQPRGAL